MLKVSKPQNEPEREIFNIDRSDRKQECKPPRTVKVRVFDMIVECFKGKGYVEMEISDDENAFDDNVDELKTINVNDEDI